MNPNYALTRPPTPALPSDLTCLLKPTRFLGLLLAFCLIGTSSTRASVLVYQFRTTGKVMGGGVEYRYSSRGYVVWNLGDNYLTWVSFAASGDSRLYRVTGGSPVVATVTGQGGKRLTTFSGANSENGRYFQDFNQGRAVVLKHRTGQTIQFPRTFKGLSHTLTAGLSSRLDDNSHTMVYSPARTIAVNDADMAASEVVADLIAELEADGYVEALPNPPTIITHSSSSSFMLDGGLPIRILSTNAPPTGLD